MNMEKEFYGVVREKRELKNINFFVLETFSGQYQCVYSGTALASIPKESYVKITGEVVPANIKKELVFSDREIKVLTIDVLSSPAQSPSINIYEKDIHAESNLIFDHRALTLRNEKNKCIFKIQSYLQNSFRNYLTFNGFISVATPKLVANGAEGGTNVFELDYFGKKAYLAQSPQLYKQMMCGVFGKVYETGPVFRAEKHASSRHLNEYTSLDIETILKDNFQELINLETDLLYNIFFDVQRKFAAEFKYLGIEHFSEATNPKTAVQFKVSEVKDILGTAGYDMSSMEEKEIAKYALEKHNTEFIYVTHFHRSVKPFYTKISSDEINTESFDLIYKGVEITSGGQRKEQLNDYLEGMKALGMNPEPFEGYLEAFKYGMPLHGGFAIGLERLTAGICNLESAKAATLFPRDVDRLTP